MENKIRRPEARAKAPVGKFHDHPRQVGAVGKSDSQPQREGAGARLDPDLPVDAIAPEGEMLREMKHTSDTYERVLSLLIIPKFEPRWARDWEEHTYDTFDRFIERGQPPIR